MSYYNKCDGYCKLKPKIEHIRLASSFLENDDNSIDFYSGVAYRMDLGFDSPICGSLEFVFVKRGMDMICLSINDFKKYFIII